MELEQKRAIVFGITNQRSIGWAIALKLLNSGAEVFVSCQNERIRSKVEKLAEGKNIKVVICDVSSREQIELALKSVGNIDILIHSIAYAPTDAVELKLSEVSKDHFQETINVSCYSFIELVSVALPFLNSGSSILGMTYIGSTRVMKGYHLLGIAKAALEASIRYLASELGEKKIRVNGISAGPVKTLSSSVFPNFNKVLDLVEEKTPLHENITSEDVAELASFLCSDRARLITGNIHFVDSGANIIGS